MGFIEDYLHTGSIITYHEKKLLIGWGERSWYASPPRSSKQVFYFPDFFLNDPKPWFTHEHTKIVDPDELRQALASIKQQSSEKLVWSAPDRQLYGSIFNELKREYIGMGTLRKGVPFVRTEAQGKMTISDIAKGLSSLLDVFERSSCYLYGFWEENQGVLGATPEILFTKEPSGKEVETVACAGTCSSNAEVSAFLSDPKELMEHQFVIEGIERSLMPYGQLVIHDMRVLHLPHLKHLYTPITLKPNKGVSFEELVRALHPTPALGAYPKEQGNVWLRSVEKLINRKRFGAPVGFIENDQERFACYVAIRNVQWDGRQVNIFAGGGVVTQSDLEKEWNEILLKLSTVKKMLALETQP